MKATHTKWLAMLALTLWANACICVSADAEKERVESTIVSAKAGSITFSLDHVYRATRDVKEGSYGLFRNLSPTKRETIYLSATNPKWSPSEPVRLGLVYETTESKDKLYKDKTFELVASPTGDRVAYKLGDATWQLAHLYSPLEGEHTTPKGFLIAPEGTITAKPEDWDKIPTLGDQAVALIKSKQRLRSTELRPSFGEEHPESLFKYLATIKSDAEIVELLLEVADTPKKFKYGWRFVISGLDEEHEALFKKKLTQRALSKDATPFEIDRAAPYMSFDSPPQIELAASAPRRLLEASLVTTTDWQPEHARLYLKASARKDPVALGEEACALLTHMQNTKSKGRGYAHTQMMRNWKIALISFSSMAPEDPCPAIAKLLPAEDVACSRRWRKQRGERYTADELSAFLAKDLLDEEFAEKITFNRQEQLILATARAKNLDLPPYLEKPCGNSQMKAPPLKPSETSATTPPTRGPDRDQEPDAQ